MKDAQNQNVTSKYNLAFFVAIWIIFSQLTDYFPWKKVLYFTLPCPLPAAHLQDRLHFCVDPFLFQRFLHENNYVCVVL